MVIGVDQQAYCKHIPWYPDALGKLIPGYSDAVGECPGMLMLMCFCFFTKPRCTHRPYPEVNPQPALCGPEVHTPDACPSPEVSHQHAHCEPQVHIPDVLPAT